MICFKLCEGAKLPTRGSVMAAGLDIHCMDMVVLRPHERKLVYTGVTLADCPKDIYLRIAPRSKLANDFGLDVLAGVVDSDYRGKIGVILYNTTDFSTVLQKGTAIAQLIPEVIKMCMVYEVETTTKTDRGVEGIHSTDKRLGCDTELVCSKQLQVQKQSENKMCVTH